ncbi:FAD:protein FMN transferase [bacterium]|nr:FAD:protein FMN transferase [bacterium]MDB4300745.1 FAD:protein FMN transferase [bacterium]MDB4377881.1 FAD:protein FMN transferase [Akkermansiaceae bacterium]
MRWFIGLLFLLIAGCEKTPSEPIPSRIEIERPLMGTLFKVIAYSTDQPKARRAIEDAFAEAAEIEAIATDYDPDSELNRLCDAPTGTAVAVSLTLFNLLAQAHEMAIVTEGAYDPTLGAVTQLWRESRLTRRLPDPDLLENARASGGYLGLLLDHERQTVTLTKHGLRLDLGGIAKGYAADVIHDHLAAAGITQTLVAAGGDLRLGDAPPEKDGWEIALRTFALTPTGSMTLKNCAVSTSGDLHQHVVIGGKSYAHIIDPQTGLGLTEQKAASVIAPTASLTDPLATAACVHLEPKKLLILFPKASFRILSSNQEVRPLKNGIFEKD